MCHSSKKSRYFVSLNLELSKEKFLIFLLFVEKFISLICKKTKKNKIPINKIKKKEKYLVFYV